MGVLAFLRPSRKKILFLILIISVISALGFFFSRPKQEKLETAIVKRQDVRATVAASGVLAGRQAVDLRFQTVGKMTFMKVKTGDRVFAGQVLAGLDSRDLAIQLKQAENTLRDEQATVDKVLDDIHLFQYGNGGFPNVGTANETMTQRQLRTTAEVARDNAFDSIKLSKLAFEDTVVASPIDGTVTEALEVPGQIVTASDLIARVVDLSALFFEAEVDEADIANISAGQEADVTFNTYPDKIFKGTVSQILPATKTTTSNATIIIVKIALQDKTIIPIVGLGGQASITVSEAKNVLTVPTESIKTDGTVLVKENGTLRSVKITTGLSSDTHTEVKSGLSEGQQIILNPPGD